MNPSYSPIVNHWSVIPLNNRFVLSTLCTMTSSNENIFRVTVPLWGKIDRSPVNSPYKGQWRGALMFSLIGAWMNGWVNNGEAGDLRRHHAHYDFAVMIWRCAKPTWWLLVTDNRLFSWFTANFCNATIPPPIARFMGPTWGPSGTDRTQLGPCYLGREVESAILKDIISSEKIHSKPFRTDQ